MIFLKCCCIFIRTKLDYFSIVVIRGLGIGLLINLLGWIIPPNLIMILFILLFGSLNMSYGNRLITKREEIRVQLGALIVLFIALVIGILIYLHVIQDPTCLVNLVLFCVLIPIRIYYIKKKF